MSVFLNNVLDECLALPVIGHVAPVDISLSSVCFDLLLHFFCSFLGAVIIDDHTRSYGSQLKRDRSADSS